MPFEALFIAQKVENWQQRTFLAPRELGIGRTGEEWRGGGGNVGLLRRSAPVIGGCRESIFKVILGGFFKVLARLPLGPKIH